MNQGLSGLIASQTAEGDTPPATSLAGIWRSDITKTKRYPGGFDGFYQAQLTLTDAGRAAQAAYDPLSSENPESTCAGRPTPSMLDSTSIYMMEIDLSRQEEVVIIRGEELFRYDWATGIEQRFPSLVGRIFTMNVPGGEENASFRDDTTIRIVRRNVQSILGLVTED